MVLVKWSYSSMKGRSSVRHARIPDRGIPVALQLRFGVQFFPCLRGEEVGIFLAKALDGSAAVFIQPFAVIIQLAADAGEVEIEY